MTLELINNTILQISVYFPRTRRTLWKSVISRMIGTRSDRIGDWLSASGNGERSLAKMLETSARVGARDLNLSRHVLRHSASISADLWPFGVLAADDRSPAEDRKINDLSTFRDEEETPVSRATIASSSSRSSLSLRDPPVRARPTEEALRELSCYARAPESRPDLFPLINNTTRSNSCCAFDSFRRDFGQAIVFKEMALYLWAVTPSDSTRWLLKREQWVRKGEIFWMLRADPFCGWSRVVRIAWVSW